MNQHCIANTVSTLSHKYCIANIASQKSHQECIAYCNIESQITQQHGIANIATTSNANIHCLQITHWTQVPVFKKRILFPL